ncbi:plasmid partitioning protein [Komagataeibacter saccharivorans]|uniref:ParB N-terminal domain-containing protein n=1 Tax=Komagataeibacter saccharivorans TaxID=265959 RepID=UPI000D7C292F|nr:ParB N-terminal domain-containing protein [Komagataeibacter saccharivorans]PYD49626.1 plasmid partitioning protein [Komagataeibacter saccharivorans]GBQ41289.1 chromosome partitioning nuclease protein ParB [Komagataeibacter saccharivorans NRIC 0614]
MELREIDPKTLRANPDNPRRAAPPVEEDRRLALNIRAVGLIHPPLVREGGDGVLTIIAGHRRARCSIMAKLKTIPVFVTGADEELDGLVAASENMIRLGMSEPDQWRAVSRMRSEQKMKETAICKALMVTPAYLRRLDLLAHLHPPILDAIELGIGPDDDARKAIAKASPEEQARVWAEIWAESAEEGQDPADYRMTVEDGQHMDWDDLARAFSIAAFYARDARFDDAAARRHGIVWEEDLFGEGGQDNRYTSDARAYAAAQREAMEAGLPANGHITPTDDYGYPVLPENAYLVQAWHEAGEDDQIAVFLHPVTLRVGEKGFRIRVDASATSRASESPGPVVEKPRERPDISGTGLKMIGEIRTLALHRALDGAADAVDPWDLVGALLLALGCGNVTVKNDTSHIAYHQPTARDNALAALFPEGHLVRDPALMRHHAMTVVRSIANCDVSPYDGSGPQALLLGILFGADSHMPNMAVEDFLKTYSKAGITRAVQAEGLPEQATGKLMRAALINHVGPGGHWVPDVAGFAGAPVAWKEKLDRQRGAAARMIALDAELEADETHEDAGGAADAVAGAMQVDEGEADMTALPNAATPEPEMVLAA